MAVEGLALGGNSMCVLCVIQEESVQQVICFNSNHPSLNLRLIENKKKIIKVSYFVAYIIFHAIRLLKSRIKDS